MVKEIIYTRCATSDGKDYRIINQLTDFECRTALFRAVLLVLLIKLSKQLPVTDRMPMVIESN